jgi:hypothetical protein
MKKTIVLVMILLVSTMALNAQSHTYKTVTMQKYQYGSLGSIEYTGKYFNVQINGSGYSIYLSNPGGVPFNAYVQYERVQWASSDKWYVYNLKRDSDYSHMDILISTSEKLSDMAKYGKDAMLIFAVGGVNPVLYHLK